MLRAVHDDELAGPDVFDGVRPVSFIWMPVLQAAAHDRAHREPLTDSGGSRRQMQTPIRVPSPFLPNPFVPLPHAIYRALCSRLTIKMLCHYNTIRESTVNKKAPAN